MGETEEASDLSGVESEHRNASNTMLLQTDESCDLEVALSALPCNKLTLFGQTFFHQLEVAVTSLGVRPPDGLQAVCGQAVRSCSTAACLQC